MLIRKCAVIFFVLYYHSIIAQDTGAVIQKLKSQLEKGQITVSNILSDTTYMFLHPQTEFREMIKQHAKAERIKIVSDTEPGTRITVKCEVKNKQGKPVSGALVYSYQTSDKGWYSDTAAHILILMGDMKHARLFGYVKTDKDGKFELETVKPKGYPRSDLPAHIHIAMWKDDKHVSGVPGELQFDDDPRMTPERRKRSVQDRNIISKNSGTTAKPVYFYEIICD